uniref:phenylalanine--tRNA ligase n=1 Tax=Osmundaria fimbriata TaxID=228265 RepID=A0A1Z1M508_OSMFI|nr:Phenylalanine-tRNA ligase beta subunit [Osmundaria fimbriata]ARW60931.1 Phenylalanine-tRNA ligase beta subunit [Osmundaria fimbriata]
MKFSWTLLNNLINLQNIKFEHFQEKLILSGIEINEIKYNDKDCDKIIDLSITTNRKEICSILNLATEISSIFNIPIRIYPIKFKEAFKNTSRDNCNNINSISNNILYYRLHYIKYTRINKTPQWLLNYLKIHNVNITSDLFQNISKYIKLKWSQIFYTTEVVNLPHILNKLKIIHKSTSNENNICSKFISYTDKHKDAIKNNRKTQILIFVVYNTKIENNTFNSIDFFENAYIDTLKLISSFTECSINKSYYEYNYNDLMQLDNKVIINKQDINTILGPIKQTKFQFLSTETIFNILTQLNFVPQYQRKRKEFITTIPSQRYHDLKRKIDIIEEISRIHEFRNFLEKLPVKNSRGTTSKTYLKIKKIRHTLRELGFHEVINCCLINNKNNISNKINLQNPITKEQKELRSNILENLINNYKNNKKYQNEHIEIFEIGKVFRKNEEKCYIEEQYLAGLLINPQFTRNKWSDQPNHASLFHAKGIIETFLEKINSKTILQKISPHEDFRHIRNTISSFHNHKRIGIYNKLNQVLIGIIGQVKHNYIDEISNNKEKNIYIFEINLQKLSKTIYKNNHLNYIIKPYSNYPSVTRDISIKINYQKSINDIINTIINANNKLIESVEVFNEYNEIMLKSRSIGLRITYRLNNRTLNNKDILNIDSNLQIIVDQLQRN